MQKNEQQGCWTKHRFKLSQKGFTLIEILVALFLVTLVVGLFAGNPFSTRDNLERDIFNLERALRYAKDESSLRNAIVRLRVNLEYPQSYILEYGPDDNFVLPPEVFGSDVAVEYRAEIEFREELLEEIDRKFHRVSAFSQGEKPFLQGVTVIGAGTHMGRELITENQFAIHVYPTGEMDSGVIILASDDEIGALSFEAFLDDFEIEYIPINPDARGELIDVQFDLAQRVFNEWLR